MADNVYLLETRLSPVQQAALGVVRTVARQHGLTVFLVGGAVRDLMSGSPVRDLDFAVQGAAMELRADLEAAGGVVSGEDTERQALYLRFSGAVRVEVGSTLAASYPKPGRPEYEPTTILEDLRRRDFTANAMALSLNDGSFGLLMDPLNGVADIENRELRLVSNYGFIEDPVRMIRAARLQARLGWQMEERTRARYETGKEENYIAAMQPAERAYELEEVFHEEEPLRVMRRLEEEGWLKLLSDVLSVSKANTAELGRLRDVQMQFQTRGVVADAAAANFPLLTAKLSPAEMERIRSSFPRAGFTEEIELLEGAAKELVTRVVSKEMAAPSAAYRFLLEAAPATVVYAAFSSRSTAFQAKVKSFLTDWPTAQSRIPYALMTEMRITSELPEYAELTERLFYALMDGQLGTTEEMRAFLEPYSPPAPPPPVSLRRARAPRKEAKGSKSKKKAEVGAATLGVAETEEDEMQRDGADASTLEVAAEASAEPKLAAAQKVAKPAKPVKATGEAKAAGEDKEAPVSKAAAETKTVAVAKGTAEGKDTAALKGAAEPKPGQKSGAPKPKVAEVKAAASKPSAVLGKAKAAAKPQSKSAPVAGKAAVAKGKSSGKAAVPAPASAKRAAAKPTTAGKPVAAGKKSAVAKKAAPQKAATPAKSGPAAKGKTAAKSVSRPTAVAKKPLKKAAAKAEPARRSAGKVAVSPAGKSKTKTRR